VRRWAAPLPQVNSFNNLFNIYNNLLTYLLTYMHGASSADKLICIYSVFILGGVYTLYAVRCTLYTVLYSQH
jgi:hypothetical protein